MKIDSFTQLPRQTQFQTFDLDMAIDPRHVHKIAKHMARMHSIPLLPCHGNEVSILWMHVAPDPETRILSRIVLPARKDADGVFCREHDARRVSKNYFTIPRRRRKLNVSFPPGENREHAGALPQSRASGDDKIC